MRRYLFLVTLLISTTIVAQESNIFLQRDFWKSDPGVKEIKKKIKEGNDPSAQASHGFDGVAFAIIDNVQTKSIKFMLEQDGNPVDKLTHGGLTYLQWAAYKGNVEVMDHLLSLGADPHMKNSGGTNMLLMAALGGVINTEVYDLIIQHGVDIQYVNSDGANALLLLASSNNATDLAVFEYLVEQGISLESADSEGNNIINYAAKGGNLEALKMAVAKNVSHKSLNSKGENALFYAAYGRRRGKVELETFTYLESLGLQVDVVNWEGQTPLHHAIRKGNVAVVDFFLERGVNINQIDKSGNTALINAIGTDIKKLERVLPLVAEVNHQNQQGHSALTMAIKRGSKESFDLLVENGANVNQTDATGNNLLYYAFQHYSSRKEEVFDYIISVLDEQNIEGAGAYSEGNSLAHIAIEKNSPYLLKKALSVGADINHQNKDGLSSLHLAAMQASDNTLLMQLMEYGADINILTQFEESAYDLAMQNEQLSANSVDFEFLRQDK